MTDDPEEEPAEEPGAEAGELQAEAAKPWTQGCVSSAASREMNTQITGIVPSQIKSRRSSGSRSNSSKSLCRRSPHRNLSSSSSRRRSPRRSGQLIQEAAASLFKEEAEADAGNCPVAGASIATRSRMAALILATKS